MRHTIGIAPRYSHPLLSGNSQKAVMRTSKDGAMANSMNTPQSPFTKPTRSKSDQKSPGNDPGLSSCSLLIHAFCLSYCTSQYQRTNRA